MRPRARVGEGCHAYSIDSDNGSTCVVARVEAEGMRSASRGATEGAKDEDDSDSSWLSDEELGGRVNGIDDVEDRRDARCLANVQKQLAIRKRPRAAQVIHTPESWHNLMHSGRLLSEATAKSSSARFEINGRVKDGCDLNASDLAALEGARMSCPVCKQTKTVAPAARRARKVMMAIEDCADARELPKESKAAIPAEELRCVE